LYDPNETRQIQVNMKNKATSLKKIILDSIGLWRKANIILLKQVDRQNPETGANEKVWEPFSENDYNQTVKAFEH